MSAPVTPAVLHEFFKHGRPTFGTRTSYREAVASCAALMDPGIEVHIEDVAAYSHPVFEALIADPLMWLAAAEEALEPAPHVTLCGTADSGFCPPEFGSSSSSIGEGVGPKAANRLGVLSGVVIGAGSVMARPTTLVLECRACRAQRSLNVRLMDALRGIPRPRQCATTPETCGAVPYICRADLSTFVSLQRLRIQDAPEAIPPGEVPRQVSAYAERSLVAAHVPGQRVSLLVVQQLRGVSAQDLAEPVNIIVGSVRPGTSGPPDVRQRLLRSGGELGSAIEAIAAHADPLAFLARQLCPEIYGLETIKRALVCQLLGGCRRLAPASGTPLRGSIHVLLVGDPGTAKSHLLHAVRSVAKIAIYTCGRGSSAAGLTAAVVRDAGSRDLILEAGAMVLADGGVVCIDEFDKMGDRDRVAIHEAMEQQTVSIAKAGIVATLNARTSVLAAANPIPKFGDLSQAAVAAASDRHLRGGPAALAAYQETILSRFDLIFFLGDLANLEVDAKLSAHVVGRHQGDAPPSGTDAATNQLLRAFLAIASEIRPVLSHDAARAVLQHYLAMREADRTADDAAHVTVRQLEGLIRLTEAVAKAHLVDVATHKHAMEAIRIFQQARDSLGRTSQATTARTAASEPDLQWHVEQLVKALLPLDASIRVSALTKHLVKGYNLQEEHIAQYLKDSVARGDLAFSNRNFTLTRKR